MVQETTQEFSRRLEYAVDQHPLAPETPYGRQRWVIEKLQRETGVKVSPNTMNKWFRGLSRPREDNVRQLARILNVDEVWLAMGRTPAVDAKAMEEEVAKASGFTMLVAGLLESRGLRVSFPGAEEEGVSLFVNKGGDRIAVTVVVPQDANGKVSFAVPEPVKNNRIVAVEVRQTVHCTACLDLIDLTDAPRHTFGGFSVIAAERRKDGRFKVDGERRLFAASPEPEAVLA